MCWRCELLAAIKKSWETHGQFLMAVQDEESGTSFTYTIGNYRYDLPEFLVLHYAPRLSILINAICLEHRRRGGFKDGDEWKWDDAEFPVRFVKIDKDLDEYTNWTRSVKGDDQYEVLQILLPDTDGRWPGEPGCHPAFNKEILR